MSFTVDERIKLKSQIRDAVVQVKLMTYKCNSVKYMLESNTFLCKCIRYRAHQSINKLLLLDAECDFLYVENYPTVYREQRQELYVNIYNYIYKYTLLRWMFKYATRHIDPAG